MNIAASPGGDVPLRTAATLSISATRVDPGRGTAVLFELHPERRHCDASSTNILYGNDKCGVRARQLAALERESAATLPVSVRHER